MNRKFYKVVLDSSVPQEDDIAYSSPFPDDFDINDIRIISTKSFNKYTNVIYKFSDKVKLSGFQIEQVPNEITKYCPTPKSIKLKISVDEEDVEIDVKPGKKIDLSDSDEMKKIVLMLENNPNNKFLCFGKTIINYTE
ncbi:hypothetical protein GPJ56_000664 [Histomonas meleagridis]|uniref:uncharacterized protein n=1 Tax=Histomonas meleagridis TaxID=135588 RepID=UPI003559A4CD|nr:hypothetical protein GPJ56_000664 [Histomonas meleagridis]KAH0804793.1 hypothetical protein GO595_002487 [Histomonas meleagridis]